MLYIYFEQTFIYLSRGSGRRLHIYYEQTLNYVIYFQWVEDFEVAHRLVVLLLNKIRRHLRHLQDDHQQMMS